MSIKDKYAIVGVGYTPQGVIPARTTLGFHLEACAAAIADAGLRREDVDGLICYRGFPASEGKRMSHPTWWPSIWAFRPSSWPRTPTDPGVNSCTQLACSKRVYVVISSFPTAIAAVPGTA